MPTRRIAAVAAATVAALAAPTVAHAAVPLPPSGTWCHLRIVPSVVGMDQTTATRRLRMAGYRQVEATIQKTDGYPVVVVAELPAAGTRTSTCTTVRIILGE